MLHVGMYMTDDEFLSNFQILVENDEVNVAHHGVA